MKKLYFITALLFCYVSQAQTTINFDANDNWLGFMNVSNKPAPFGDGAYQFGSGWGVPDLVAEFNTTLNQVALKPNRINDPDPYWQTSGVLEGNKIMDASSYVEDDTLVGTVFSFTGNVSSNTLNSTGLNIPFTTLVFIRVFDGSYALLEEISQPIGTGDFTLTYNNTQPGAVHIQYGFNITGVNINSDPSFDADYDNLGSIIVQPRVLSVEDAENAIRFITYPNPTADTWNFVSENVQLDTVTIYSLVGRKINEVTVNARTASVDASQLPKGVYFAVVRSGSSQKTVKVIKQ